MHEAIIDIVFDQSNFIESLRKTSSAMSKTDVTMV